MNTNTFITTNQILADVLKFVDDERYEINSKGFYISTIQRALEGLAFDTFFDERNEDFPFPTDTFNLEMPKGAFNIRNIYLFNGTQCDIGRSQNVYWKRNFITHGQGYFANNKSNNVDDPFYPNNFRTDDKHITDALGGKGRNVGNPAFNRGSTVENTFYYNIQNGLIMFSSRCAMFEKVLLVFNGTGTDIGDVPLVPIFFREAIIDFVTETALRIRMAKEPAGPWRVLWQIAKQNIGSDFNGSWYKAERMVKQMNSGQRSNLKEYLSKMAY